MTTPVSMDTVERFPESPTQSIEAERAILQVILTFKNAIYRVICKIPIPEIFYYERHRIIYKHMIQMSRENQPIDIITLGNHISDKKDQQAIGKKSELAKLVDSSATPSNVDHYTNIVIAKYRAREMMRLGHELEAKSMEGYDVSNLREEAMQRIYNLSNSVGYRGAETFGQIIPGVLDEIDKNISSGKNIIGIPTGFVAFDQILQGLKGGNLIILAGRPSMGKSALALNILENLAAQGISSLLFSLEMTKMELGVRILSNMTDIPGTRILSGSLTQEQFSVLTNAVEKLYNYPLHIDQCPKIPLLELIARSHQYHSLYGVKAIVVDYLQKIKFPHAEKRYLQIGEGTGELKALAMMLNIPIILCSQLGRDVEYRHPPRPRLSDLRESGDIEQDADSVVFLYRPSYYGIKDDGKGNLIPERMTEIIIAKNRNGGVGTVKLDFHAPQIKFVENVPF